MPVVTIAARLGLQAMVVCNGGGDEKSFGREKFVDWRGRHLRGELGFSALICGRFATDRSWR
jgi:hypothetical protein